MLNRVYYYFALFLDWKILEKIKMKLEIKIEQI